MPEDKQARDERGSGPIEADVLERLLVAAAPIFPPPDRLAAVRQRVLDGARAAARAMENTRTVRFEGGEWQPIAPGVQLKPLHSDATGRSFLLRLEPGAGVPDHAHDADEECMVVAGDLRIGSVEMRAGDYHVARGGSRHTGIVSQGGALVFIRSQASHTYGTPA
jgi:anti-sigma factor ChrR (cupin superfamily)